MALIMRASQIPASPMATGDAGAGGGGVEVTMVYGDRCDMMITRRAWGPPGKPHFHDSEQLNWVAEGSVRFVIDGETFDLEKGDFLRIPCNAMHSTEVTDPNGCLLIEAHSPGFHADPLFADIAVGLYGPTETPRPQGNPRNLFP
jgi:mannose-6-phosphate isomerase-like protein (cupin superfamily)